MGNRLATLLSRTTLPRRHERIKGKTLHDGLSRGPARLTVLEVARACRARLSGHACIGFPCLRCALSQPHPSAALTAEFADPPPLSLQTLSLDSEAPSTALGPNATAELPASLPDSLLGFAHLVLATAEPGLKCALTREAVARMRAGKLKSIRPSVGEVCRVRNEVGLLDKPPRLQEAVRPWQTSKR